MEKAEKQSQFISSLMTVNSGRLFLKTIIYTFAHTIFVLSQTTQNMSCAVICRNDNYFSIQYVTAPELNGYIRDHYERTDIEQKMLIHNQFQAMYVNRYFCKAIHEWKRNVNFESDETVRLINENLETIYNDTGRKILVDQPDGPANIRKYTRHVSPHSYSSNKIIE